MKYPLKWIRGSFSVFEVEDADGKPYQLLASDIRELVEMANVVAAIEAELQDFDFEGHRSWEPVISLMKIKNILPSNQVVEATNV